MINKTEWNRMMEGKLYNPYKVGDNSFEKHYMLQILSVCTVQTVLHKALCEHQNPPPELS